MSKSLPEYLRELADWIHHEAFHKLPDELEEKADEVRELAQTLESGVAVVPVELAQRLLKRCRQQQLEHERLSEQAADTGMILSAEAFAAAAAEADADALEAILSRLQQHGGEAT